MKTILLTLSTSAEVKNIMRTSVITTLLQDVDVRIIACVSAKKIEFYQKQFLYDRVIFEPIIDLEYGQSNIRTFWRSLSYNSVPSETVRIRSNKQFFDHPSFFQALALIWKKPVWIFGHTRIWRECVRWVEYNLFTEDAAIWKRIFEKYSPDIVVATNPVHGTNIALMKYARRTHTKLIGYIKTWDNLSSKGLLLVKPDILIVPNSVVQNDAVQFGDMLCEQIFDGGCPQYDTYLDPAEYMSREEVCEKIGVDPNKKFLLYCMGGVMNQDDPSEHLMMLDKAIEDGRLPAATILLRAHPKYDVRILKLDQCKHVVFQQPGVKVGDAIGEWELGADDIKLMLNMLRHADVEYNTGSTMTLESAIFDRPIVVIGFDGYTKRPYYQSVKHGLDVTHYRYVLSTGGVVRVDTEGELISATLAYLQSPVICAEGRKKIVTDLIGAIGGAGERIGRKILEHV